jgi:hypothetical protein
VQRQRDALVLDHEARLLRDQLPQQAARFFKRPWVRELALHGGAGGVAALETV